MDKEIHDEIDTLAEGLQFGKIILTFHNGEIKDIDIIHHKRKKIGEKK